MEKYTKGDGHDFKAIESFVGYVLSRIHEKADNPSDVIGTPTGFYDLDRITAGLHPGELVVLAACPGMGKTSMALSIATHVAVNERLPVAIATMGMGAHQLTHRIIASLSGINIDHLWTGRLADDEWQRLSDATKRLTASHLFIDDTTSLTVNELCSKLRRLNQQQGKIGLILLDCLQLMSGDCVDENHATELVEISHELKTLARELKCPVIVLSPLNRSIERRTDKRPMLSDLREFGNIGQIADTVIFLYRDDHYTKKASEEPGVTEVILAKQIWGPTKTVKLSGLQ